MIITTVSNEIGQLQCFINRDDNLVLVITGNDENDYYDSHFVFEDTSDAVYFADQLKRLAQQIAVGNE